MTLITYNPRKSIVSDVDRWFDSFWNFDHTFDRNYKFQPKFNITESENSYNITADLPGIEKKDVDLSISEGIITISGERKSSDNQEDKFSRFNEIRYGSFEKSFYLPEEANINKINGILFPLKNIPTPKIHIIITLKMNLV